MTTRAISDRQLQSIKEGLLGQKLYNSEKMEQNIMGICWKMRTGAPWRDLPEEFGPWSTVYNQFNRWSKKGIIDNLFKIGIKCTG